MGSSLRLVIAAALLIGVGLLGIMVGAGMLTGFDDAIANALSLRSGQSSDVLIAAMQAVSWIGGGTARWVMLIALCLCVV